MCVVIGIKIPDRVKVGRGKNKGGICEVVVGLAGEEVFLAWFSGSEKAYNLQILTTVKHF